MGENGSNRREVEPMSSEQQIREAIINYYGLIRTVKLGVTGWTDSAMTFITDEQMSEVVGTIVEQINPKWVPIVDGMTLFATKIEDEVWFEDLELPAYGFRVHVNPKPDEIKPTWSRTWPRQVEKRD